MDKVHCNKCGKEIWEGLVITHITENGVRDLCDHCDKEEDTNEPII
jgi:hypothetical protein